MSIIGLGIVWGLRKMAGDEISNEDINLDNPEGEFCPRFTTAESQRNSLHIHRLSGKNYTHTKYYNKSPNTNYIIRQDTSSKYQLSTQKPQENETHNVNEEILKCTSKTNEKLDKIISKIDILFNTIEENNDLKILFKSKLNESKCSDISLCTTPLSSRKKYKIFDEKWWSDNEIEIESSKNNICENEIEPSNVETKIENNEIFTENVKKSWKTKISDLFTCKKSKKNEEIQETNLKITKENESIINSLTPSEDLKREQKLKWFHENFDNIDSLTDKKTSRKNKKASIFTSCFRRKISEVENSFQDEFTEPVDDIDRPNLKLESNEVELLPEDNVPHKNAKLSEELDTLVKNFYMVHEQILNLKECTYS